MYPRSLERLALLLLSLLYFGLTGYIASSKPYWLDEITTIGIASLPGAGDVISYLAEGREPHPPLPFLTVRLSFILFGPGELPARLPSMLAYFGALVAAYHFLRFRIPVPAAIGGTAMLALGPAFYYATEARGYALLLCASALAALAWQRHSRPGLALSLALAISAHYYGVLLAPVFAAATLIRDRRTSLPTLSAIGAGFAPVLLYLPFIRSALNNSLVSWQYNPENIFRPSLDQLISLVLGAAAFLGLPLLLLLVLAVTLFRRRRALPLPGITPAERALAIGFLLLPLVLFAISKATVGAYFSRYAIAWNLGIPILAASALVRIAPRPAQQWAFAASCLFGVVCWPALYLPKPTPSAELTAAWPAVALPESLPVVHADALEFGAVWHYAPAGIRHRLLYLHDVSVSRLTRDPVPEHAVQLSAGIFPYRTEPYGHFLKSHSAFLLLSTGDVLREWLPQRLRAEGFRLEALQSVARHTLYRVSAPSAADD